MAGRRSKLTPEVTSRILNAIRGGVPWMVAVASAGVDYSTFCKWRQRGERAMSGPFFQFCQDLKKAESDSIIRNITIVQKAAMGGEVIERTTITRPDGTIVVREKRAQPVWQAAAWWLERKYPADWARRERLEHGDAKGPLVAMDCIIIEDKVTPAAEINPRRAVKQTKASIPLPIPDGETRGA